MEQGVVKQREILFRGQTVSQEKEGKKIEMLPVDSKWVYGSVFKYTGSEYSIIYNQDTIEKHLVYSDTVCQYTDLTDKNRKKIFDGDIVSVTHDKLKNEEEGLPFEYDEYTRNYVVEFVNTGCHLGYRCRNKNIHFMLTQNTIRNHDICVIGNIFDNPELLEGENANVRTV